MTDPRDRIFGLLPLVHRQRDAERGWPLRDLLRVVGEQVAVVEEAIAQGYEDWFIETCQPRIVPYIGDLVGYEVPADGGAGSVPPRREVADLVRLRRRKGAASVLESLARAVGGWPARVVELGRRVVATPSLVDPTPLPRATASVRTQPRLARLGSAFDTTAHTTDVRSASTGATTPRYGAANVALFVWRARAHRVTRGVAYCFEQEAPNCFTFSAIGDEVALVTRPEPEADDPRLRVPAPITRTVLARGDHVSGRYYGVERSLAIWAPGWRGYDADTPIPSSVVRVVDLSSWQVPPWLDTVAVDPERGRIVFPPDDAPEDVRVTYHYAFPADVGGGEYRRPTVRPPLPGIAEAVFRPQDIGDGAALADALCDDTNPISWGLFSHLSPETRLLLTRYRNDHQPTQELVEALIRDLDRFVLGESLLDVVRFPADVPGKATWALAALDPTGDALMRLNRLLLEDAYPDAIARSFVTYPVGAGQPFTTITEALDHWHRKRPRHAVIEIVDSGVYAERLVVDLRAGQTLALRAGAQADGSDRPTRPVVQLLDWRAGAQDALHVRGKPHSRFVLDGITVSGRGVRVIGDLAALTIRHVTLVPGWMPGLVTGPGRPLDPSLSLEDLVHTRVRIERSVLGPIQLHHTHPRRVEPLTLELADSIVDAGSADEDAIAAQGGGHAHLVARIWRCTIRGRVVAQGIAHAENTIFDGRVRVAQTQSGCLRYCWLPTWASHTPPRFRCQPELATAHAPARGARVRPWFRSTRYGDAGYFVLRDDCAVEVVRGAHDESEMGVYHHLQQPGRLATLRTRLAEFAPADFGVAVIRVS